MLALCFAPTLPMVLVSIALLYQNPDFQDMTLATLGTVVTLFLGFLLHRRIRTTLLLPISDLAQEITAVQPGLPLSNRAPLLEQVIISLEQRLISLEGDRLAIANKLAETERHLRETSEKFSTTLAHIELERSRDGSAHEAERNVQTHLAASTAPLLSRIVTLVNLLTTEQGFDEEVIAELTSAAATLNFVTREISGFDYSAEPEAGFDLRQLVDEAVTIASMAGIEYIPVYTGPGNYYVVGRTRLLKALTLNFLLARGEPARPAAFTVEHLPSGQVRLRVEGEGSGRSHMRLTQLLGATGAHLDDDILSVMLRDDRRTRTPAFSLRANIVTDDDATRAALEARLATMGITTTIEASSADLCLTTLPEPGDIANLRDQLPEDALLLLLANRTPMPIRNTVQLENPILHGELEGHLRALAEALGQALPRVLLVDDDASHLRLLTHQLDNFNVEIETADTGAMALALASRHNFALAIVDLQLPDGSGADFGLRLRSGNGEAIPTVILTAQIDSQQAARIRQRGIRDVLTKPVSNASLVRILTGLETTGPVEIAGSPRPRAAGKGSGHVIFDAALSLQIANGSRQVAAELLHTLVQDIEPELAAINRLHSAGEAASMIQQVHRLHGAVGYCGLPRLKTAIARLETLAREGNAEHIKMALSVVNVEVKAFLTWFDPQVDYFEDERGSRRNAD